MKQPGSILAFTRQRNAALLCAFRRIASADPVIRLDDVAEKVVNSPSPRFWVSEERAAAVISAMMRGIPVLDSMRPSKREMFTEIYRRVLLLRSTRPESCLLHLVIEVVNSPAPKFYMKASSAIERLFKIRKMQYVNRFCR